MEGGGGRVSPTATSARRYKVPVASRFPSGYVRQEMEQGDVSHPEVNRLTAVGGGTSGSLQDRDHGGEELQSSAGDRGGQVPKRGEAGVGKDCILDCSDGNAASEEGDSLPKNSKLVYSEGIENNRVRTEPVGGLGTANNNNSQGFHGSSAAENCSAGKACIPGCVTAADGTLPGCRKGTKTVATWRFQPKWSLPSKQTEAPASVVADGLKQCAPAMASKRPRVKHSAMKNRSLLKVQKGLVSKKRKTNKGCHRRATPKRKVHLIREDVLSTLREFRIVYKKLLEEEETKWRERGHGLRPDIAALNIYKERFCVSYNEQRYVGSIPGIQIGDVFNSNAELSILGIHRAQLLSVDQIERKDGMCLAISIVSYAQPSASHTNMDFLLHVGSTAAMSDQNMEGTELALKGSMDTHAPVRVIHALITEPGDNSPPERPRYVYGGLYWVEKFCREKIMGDQCVNTFHLKRMAGQQQIDIPEVLRSRYPEPFDGIFMGDISGGLEKIPISAINSISNEYPMTFRYISQIQYPPKYLPDPPSGCECVDGCSLSQKCSCAVKNGGMFPYNDIGLLEDRPLIYECGPSCTCPPTCRNRVSQHGIKFRFQVYKTKSMGWGVRCLDFVPSGSFVCEYIGELLEEKEAQERESDEYLFATGHNYYDVPRWEGLCKKIPSLQNGRSEDAEIGFAFDGLNSGNFARFINHSCTPNLFPQNVLHDHGNKSMPHIMFFAAEDIPPLKDLSYDYNYVIDEVYDSDGNIKKKQCFCGSIECTGWLY